MFIYEINNIRISFPFSSSEVNEYILKLINSDKKFPKQIITLNSLIYLQSKFNKFTKRALIEASLILPDSLGIVFICSIFMLKWFRRFTGVELIEELCKTAQKQNFKIYLFGSKKENLEIAAKILNKKYNINVVGFHHGYIFNSLEEQLEVINDINKKKPDILFVGLPTEIQEAWIYRNIEKLNCKIVVGIGGSFDVISKKLPRAPKFFQFFGLEWYFRLLIEPFRIKRIIKIPLALFFLFYDCFRAKLYAFKNS